MLCKKSGQLEKTINDHIWIIRKLEEDQRLVTRAPGMLKTNATVFLIVFVHYWLLTDALKASESNESFTEQKCIYDCVPTPPTLKEKIIG